MRMSNKTLIVKRLSIDCRSLVLATLAMVSLGLAGPVVAQEPAEKKFSQRLKDYWDKLVAQTESTAKAAGDEYHKLKDETAKSSGPAREKLAAEMEDVRKKWAVAREKLAHALEFRMNALHEEFKTLDEKAKKESGPAREKMAAEMEKLHEEWIAARAKVVATLSANLKSSREELEHLKAHASSAAEKAKAKLSPRMDRLKAEFHKNREKLAAFLKADLKQTEEDMKKLGEATSHTAKLAKEKLLKKYHELKATSDELAKEQAAEEPK
jgi:polyhydroxyalkanoate synthesis regulator phasin